MNKEMSQEPGLSTLVSGFCAFRTNKQSLIDEFVAWQTPILERINAFCSEITCIGTPSMFVESILPMVSPVPTRFGFIQAESGWVVLFTNGFTGPDATYATVLSERCKCLSVRFIVTRSSRSGAKLDRKLGARLFESFDRGIRTRSVYCVNDGGRWKFGQSGSKYPAEASNDYERTPISSRFSEEELDAILAELSIYRHNPNWYAVRDLVEGVIISRNGAPPESLLEHATSL